MSTKKTYRLVENFDQIRILDNQNTSVTSVSPDGVTAKNMTVKWENDESGFRIVDSAGETVAFYGKNATYTFPDPLTIPGEVILPGPTILGEIIMETQPTYTNDMIGYYEVSKISDESGPVNYDTFMTNYKAWVMSPGAKISYTWTSPPGRKDLNDIELRGIVAFPYDVPVQISTTWSYTCRLIPGSTGIISNEYSGSTINQYSAGINQSHLARFQVIPMNTVQASKYPLIVVGTLTLETAGMFPLYLVSLGMSCLVDKLAQDNPV